jgi:acyl-CoA thioesterase-2
VSSFAEFLDVVHVGSDRYVSAHASPLSRPTLFGGAIVAQGLRAAADTATAGLFPASLHASFLRAGRAGEELAYDVERIRDGRAFATRRVSASQGDRTILTMTVSFHRDEPSADYQPSAPPRPPLPTTMSPDGLGVGSAGRIDSLGLEVLDLTDAAAGSSEASYLAWARSRPPLPADRVLHCCVLAYLSDTGAPAVAATAIGLVAGGPDREAGTVMTTSLDHAMWFHRAGRADRWLLVRGTPLSTAGSRGLVLGSISDQAGVQLASFTQEMLIRG